MDLLERKLCPWKFRGGGDRTDLSTVGKGDEEAAVLKAGKVIVGKI